MFFKRLSESKLWKEKYIKENMLTAEYTTSAEDLQALGSGNSRYAKILKEMGFIK